MNDESYVVKVRDRVAHTDKQLFGACGQQNISRLFVLVAGLVVFSL